MQICSKCEKCRALSKSLPYCQSIQDLNGKISTVPLPAGLPVAQANAVPIVQFRLADAAFEVLSIPVEPVSAVGGQIRIGERVNLYQVLPEKIDPEKADISANDQPAFKVELIAGSILVVDVRNAQGVAAESNQKSADNSAIGGSPQNEQVQILTLAVKPEAVEVILNAVAVSKKQSGLLWTTLALP